MTTTNTETIYKVFDARNRLMFVTPKLINARYFLMEKFNLFGPPKSIYYGYLMYGIYKIERVEQKL